LYQNVDIKYSENHKHKTNKNRIYQIVHIYKIEIKEFAFGKDFAHIHIGVNIPNPLSVAKVIQILKSYSSHILFQFMSKFM